jgi:hypothetical protein
VTRSDAARLLASVTFTIDPSWVGKSLGNDRTGELRATLRDAQGTVVDRMQNPNDAGFPPGMSLRWTIRTTTGTWDWNPQEAIPSNADEITCIGESRT